MNKEHISSAIWIKQYFGKDANPFVKFVSSGPKSYGICSCANYSIFKSKGFCLNYAYRQIFHFDALKEQVIAQARKIGIKNLDLHKGETLMTRNYFRIKVKINTGKELRMPYDKRVIEFPWPWHHSPKVIGTYPLGYFCIPLMNETRDIAVIILLVW